MRMYSLERLVQELGQALLAHVRDLIQQGALRILEQLLVHGAPVDLALEKKHNWKRTDRSKDQK